LLTKLALSLCRQTKNGNGLCWGATHQGYIWSTDEKVKEKDCCYTVLFDIFRSRLCLKKHL